MSDKTGTRMIDRWFPVAAVDEACGTPTGSGRVEKAIFTWFASLPIAQARAAALTSLLPDNPELKPLIETAVRHGDPAAMEERWTGSTAASARWLVGALDAVCLAPAAYRRIGNSVASTVRAPRRGSLRSHAVPTSASLSSG